MRGLRRVILGAYIIAALVGGAFIGNMIYSNRQAVRAAKSAAADAKIVATETRRAVQDATRALCNQKQSAQFRLDTATEFLRAHPKGTDDFLLLLKRSIRSAQAEVEAVADVECPA